MTQQFNNKLKKKIKLDEKLESFEDLHGDDIVNLYLDIKNKIDFLAVDLLNQESKNHFTEFIQMIYHSVHYEIPVLEDNLEEEFIDMNN